MRILRFRDGEGVKIGAVKADGVVDLREAGCRYATVLELVEGGADALEHVRDVLERASPTRELAGLDLVAPIERPGKFLAIGMNYRKHAEESERIGVAAPKRQLWFNKQTSCLSGPHDAIDPGVTEQLDYEVELGLVIGTRAKHVGAENALAHVFGYFVANDVSARDWQFHSPTFTVGKSFDTHGPIGPWIVTADEIPDPQALGLRCLVNGEVRQASNTSEMIFGVREQISYLSTAFTLEPGDLIATGTPEGVGVAMDPPRFLKPGDAVRCEIDGLGAIENRVARPQSARD